jgi:hypothetical protein
VLFALSLMRVAEAFVVASFSAEPPAPAAAAGSATAPAAAPVRSITISWMPPDRARSPPHNSRVKLYWSHSPFRAGFWQYLVTLPASALTYRWSPLPDALLLSGSSANSALATAQDRVDRIGGGAEVVFKLHYTSANGGSAAGGMDGEDLIEMVSNPVRVPPIGHENDAPTAAELGKYVARCIPPCPPVCPAPCLT